MKDSSPSWQSTVIAVALMLLVGGIFIVVFEKEGTGEALKVWGALGTIVGVLVGAVPTYFFGQKATTAARQDSKEALDVAREETKKLHSALELAQDAAGKARDKQDQAEQRSRAAEAKTKAVVAVADKETLKEALELKKDLFE